MLNASQPPSKLRMTHPQTVKKVISYAASSTSDQERPYTAGSLLPPMKTKMQNIKKVHFCTKLFKNAIFIMYEWKLGNKKSSGRRWAPWCVRGMFETNSKLANKSKTRKKIVGWALSIVVCAWNVRNKSKTRKQKIVGCTLVCKLFVPDVMKNLVNTYSSFFLKSNFLNKYWKDFLSRLELKIRISIDISSI